MAALRTLQVRVKRGAAWLDTNHPKWADRIDVPALSLSNPCQCVLGQLFGNFWIDPSGDRCDTPIGKYERAKALGFCSPYLEGYSVLDRLWRHQIKKRLAA